MYRALIVGCGRIAGLDARPGGDGPVLSHADAYHRDSRFGITACVEPDEDRLRNFMGIWPVEEGFASLEEAFAEGKRYDVASLCAPTGGHAALLEALSRHPVRMVFAEKPLLASSGEEAALKHFAEPGSPVVMVNYTRRWDPEMGELREMIQGGWMGKCRSASLSYNKGVRNNASHGVQLLSWLFGFDAGELVVDAVSRWRRDGQDGDPTVDAIVSAPEGFPIHMIGGDARDFALFELVLVMAGGVVEIRDGGWRVVTRLARPSERFPGYRELSEGGVREGGYGAAFPAALDNIVRCLEGNAQPGCGIDEALAVEGFCQRLSDVAFSAPEKEIRT